jgi:hypothetical protein
VSGSSPDYGDEDHVGAGIAIGGGTGLLIGMIAGPLGLIFWRTMRAIGGGAVGTSDDAGAFDPVVEQVKDALPTTPRRLSWSPRRQRLTNWSMLSARAAAKPSART